MKVLIAQARASAQGGAETYAAALALRIRQLGHSIGTLDVDGHVAPFSWRKKGRLQPTTRALLNWAQVCRKLPSVAQKYDRVVLAYGEGPKLPVPSLTVRHAPALFSTHPKLLEVIGARPTPTRCAYVALCRAIAPNDHSATIANSKWTEQMVTDYIQHSVDGVLYPKVERVFAPTDVKNPFQMIAVGRIVPNKKIEDAIRVLTLLRETGAPWTLIIVGRADTAYANNLISSHAAHPGLQFLPNATTEQLLDTLARASFGLHMFRSEHFGIAVAEMIQANVLPIVHNSGGVRELVSLPELRFETRQDAADKILALSQNEHGKIAKLAHLNAGDALVAALSFEQKLDDILAQHLRLEQVQHAA